MMYFWVGCKVQWLLSLLVRCSHLTLSDWDQFPSPLLRQLPADERFARQWLLTLSTCNPATHRGDLDGVSQSWFGPAQPGSLWAFGE